MMNKRCSCPVATTTTYHTHYQPHGEIKRPILAKLQKPCDIELISGHFRNNLQINGQHIKTKVWPNVSQNAEEYDDFLKRLESCKKDIFDVYFKSSVVEKATIDQMFKNLSKTTYQLIFSPNVFVPRTEKRRFAKLVHQPLDMEYQATTYRTYFNRIKELEDLKDCLKGVISKNNQEILKNDLKKILRCGRSTFNDEVSVIGRIYAKPTLPGPIDRYTLRKI